MSLAPSDESLLDNPVWHALRGPLSAFSEPGKGALRFVSDVGFFGAVERVDADGWGQLARLVGEGGVAVLFRDEVPAPPVGWKEVYRGPTFQLVADDLDPVPEVETTPLGKGDVDEMLALTKLTEPGPFMARTWELGGYIGMYERGRLIAMAGQRFSVPGHTEISAVCTHPDARRRGLAAALTLVLARSIRERGDEAFLHVLETNESALRLYLSIGFRVRRRMDVVAAQWGESDTEAASPH